MHPKRERAGAGSSGAGGTTPPPTPEPQKPAEPTPAEPATPPGTPQSGAQPAGYVPIDQLRAVTEERDTLAREKRERDTKEATEKGEWQSVAETRERERDEEKSKADGWKGKFLTVARRSAFVSKIASQVADADAAYKLAAADGLLNDVRVDDEGNADAEAIDKAVKKTIDTYKSIFGQKKSFGGDRGAQVPEADPSGKPLNPRDRMRRAYEQT